MKKIFLILGFIGCITNAAKAQVFINEMMANAPGTDPTKEYFELRGTPGLSLAGYYLISLEGQGSATPGPPGGRGDINGFFNLGSASLGANGYLIALQSGSVYTPTIVGSTVFANTIGAEWGSTSGGSSVGHQNDNPTTGALENSATSILLVNIGSGAAPLVTDDMDLDNDGILDALPAGWTLVDSIGLLDGVSGAATDVSYGAITFRVGALGTSPGYGNVIQVPGSGTSLYVGRKGVSTGSTSADWVGSVVSDLGPNSVFGATTTTDPFYYGKTLLDMQFGGINAVPEPTTLGLMALGLGAVVLYRRRR